MPAFKEIRFFDGTMANAVAAANALPVLDGGNRSVLKEEKTP